jgi:hypothetical protein
MAQGTLDPIWSQRDLPVHILGSEAHRTHAVTAGLGLDEELPVGVDRQPPGQVDPALQVSPSLNPAIEPGQINLR